MLTDLDELMLSVRDPESRAYLREALISYRGGAYRAAIVSVWIAVVYDIISKIRVLASQGDKAAEAVIKPLDTAIANHDLKALLKIEDGMLDEARDKFQLINKFEYDDLDRIKADRHRCAHPAFASDTLLFNPSPETVRAHIVHAVNHLLGHPPVQGKAAIETAVRDIASLSFPRNQQDVDKLMNLRCLDHARESLVTSIVAVLAKALLRKDNQILTGHEEAAMMALVAVSRRHTAIYEAKMREVLPKIGASLDDSTIPNIFPFLNVEPRAWNWLDEATRLRSTELCKNYKFGTTNDEQILDALSIAPLNGHFIDRLRKLEEAERLQVISKNPRVELVDEALTLLEKSAHFRDAEPRARLALLGMGKQNCPAKKCLISRRSASSDISVRRFHRRSA
jgi:hypothetical protein